MGGAQTRRFDGKVVFLHLLYDLAFLVAITLFLPYIIYRLLTSQRFRAGLGQRIGLVPRRKGCRKAIWIHGVSAGEIKTIAPLLNRIEQAYPEAEWAISTTTLAGYQMARKVFAGRFVFYFPLDIGFIVQNVIRRIDPGFIILMELEIWPNFLYKADQWGSPVMIVNGRISDKSFRGYRRLKKLLPEMDRIQLFSVQNREYQDRLLGLDVPPDKVVVTGNIKYDGIDTAESSERRPVLNELRMAESSRVLVAGSTHSGEDEILLDIFLALKDRHPDLRLILAPRHIERVEDIEKACQRRGMNPIRRTERTAHARLLTQGEVLILDTIGELDRIYSAADLVFVGGSLVPVGGHNMMEPAGKGKPVLFGPYVFNFSEDVALLLRQGAAIQVADDGDLQDWINRLLQEEETAKRVGCEARQAVFQAKGATERNFELIDRIYLRQAFHKSDNA
ncbi:MAG: 3-deoxy-D-manno-octulosonic acid transferase [Planctomycetes bacterium]|nr:3-deoxy-D-manno-octulosonic acid transferase [Planctomycetota bacterium]